MQRYYRDHHISTTAELDPESDLFRSVIVIRSVLAADDFGRIVRPRGSWIFKTEGAAELYGLLVAREFIDQRISSVNR